MAITTTTTLAELYNERLGEAVQDEIAQHLFWPGAVLSPMIKTEDFSDGGGVTWTFPKYNQTVAYDATEGTDFTTTQAVDPAEATITTTEHMDMSEITDKSLKAVQAPNAASKYMADVRENHIRALMTKFDVDILTLLQSLNSGTTNTGVNLAEAHVLACVGQCQAANMPKPWVGILHPQQWSDLINESGTPFHDVAASGTVAQEIFRNYLPVGTIYDVTWFVNTNVPTANSGADYGGGIISRACFGAVWSMMPEVRIERDESKRAFELITIAEYGVGEIDGTMGMYLISDA